MQKIFGIEKYNFYLSDITTSIIYNDESIKNKIITELQKESYLVIDTKIFNANITVKEYLKLAKFNMKLIPYFDIEKYLSTKISSLSFETQIYLKIITLINVKDKIIVFDDVLTFLNPLQKSYIIKYLKDNELTYFNFTSDIEEILYTKYLIVTSKDGVIIEGKTRSVLNEEKILKRSGFALPFSVDLSHQLKDYGLIDKEYYSIDKLVNDLWQ